MENPEEVLQLLERFTKLKQKEIPRELDDYLGFVARTGDTVYRWAIVKHLFREKLVHVITDFHDNTPSIADLPQCPNVDPFNYERMKRILLERLDAFNSAPFTVQRICELLTEPRKQYTRIDKFMRAVEKNILVVSTQEPGRRRSDSENGDSLDSIVNGDLEVNVDIEMDNEAVGIEAGPDVVPSAVTTEVTEPSSVLDEEPAATAAVQSVTEPDVPKEEVAEVASAVTVEPTATVDKEDEIKEQEQDEPALVTPTAVVEADLPKEDLKSTEENNEPTEHLVVPQPIEESSTAEDLPVPEVQPLEPTETTTEPKKESHDLVQDVPDGSEKVVDPASESADDDQPAPKQAKLAEESQEVIQPAAAAPESEKDDDVSSGSTTDSGSSSTSVESSEPTQISSVEPPQAAIIEQEQQQAAVESLPATVSSEEVPPTPTPELISAEVEPEVKPVEEPVAGVEMETAVAAPQAPAPALIPESVMATDEEDTIIQSPVDAPMVADVPEAAVKPDDNAMDVDESSVEPMEDQ